MKENLQTKMYHNLPRMTFLITYLENRDWAKLIVSGRETTNQLHAPLGNYMKYLFMRRKFFEITTYRVL